MKLNANECVPYQNTYLDLVHEGEIINLLSLTAKELEGFFTSIPSNKHAYAYTEGKWTIKELLHHIIDTERIFQYRALRYARADKTVLPGFSENDYAAVSNANKRTLKSLLAEYKAVRLATISLYETFSESEMLRLGVASGVTMSVRAIAYVLLGHQKHHINIIKSLYLV